MLVLTAILIILVLPLIILGLSFSRLRPGYLWLLATVFTFIPWVLFLISREQIPSSIPLANWHPTFIFSSSPSLLLDNISWPFAIAMLTLPLAALLTDIIHVEELNPQTWASIQALGGVGLIAVLAGNPLTILMTWVVIDIAESLVLLIRMNNSDERERVIIAFSVRIAGIVVLISAILRANGMGKFLTFDDIPTEVGGYLMLAAGLRLGVLPPNQPHLREPIMRRSLGTMIRIVPSAASLVLLVRAGQVSVTDPWQFIFILLASVSVILSAIAWVKSENELQGRPYWILAISAFILSSSALGLPVSATAWGLAMIFSGAMMFLFSTHHRWLLILSVFGAVGFSGLPLTPSWEGIALFIALPWWSKVTFYVALALLLYGYLRFAQKPKPGASGFERWMWLVYPLGLSLLTFTHFGLIYTKWLSGSLEISLQVPGWWSGLVPVGIVVFLTIISQRISITLPSFNNKFSSVFEWFYRIFWLGYRTLSRILYIISRLLEGEGSVLWALLILIVLIVTINLWGIDGSFEFR